MILREFSKESGRGCTYQKEYRYSLLVLEYCKSTPLLKYLGTDSSQPHLGSQWNNLNRTVEAEKKRNPFS